MFLFKHGQAVDGHGHIHTVPGEPAQTLQAPEIDPGAGFSAVLVLSMALAILIGRRRSA